MPADRRDGNDHVHGDQGWFEPDTEVAPELIVGGPGASAVGDTAFVPTEAELSPGDENAMVTLVTTVDGGLAVLAYSSLEHLVRCCGDRHPWVAFRTENIDALPGVTGADVLLWNEELPPELRRDADGDPDRDSQYRRQP